MKTQAWQKRIQLGAATAVLVLACSDGFFTFTGANPTNDVSIEWYAVTGGVSAYANLHGQIKATSSQNGNRSSVIVTLYR